MGDVTFTAQTRYANNLRLALGQTESLLAPKAIQRNEAGAEKVKLENLISQSKSKKKQTRHAPVAYNDTGWDGIWVAKPQPDYDADLVDTDDKLATAVDIGSGIIMSHAMAIARARDDMFLNGFYGNMITGKTGTTLNPFPSGNVIAVDVRDSGSGATGMNSTKLRKSRRKLAGNFVDKSQPWYIGLNAAQIDDLYQEVKILSRDYTAALQVVYNADGKGIQGACGFEFVEMELGNPLLNNTGLTVDGSGYRKNPFWSADGMAINYWEELFTSVDKLPQQHFETQIYYRLCGDGSRTDQNRCGYVLNVES